MAAFFAILVTGRYPRGLFDLNVGILRWTWRVQFYATAAIGTDRYPPFTLDHTDYPADLDIAYPERLSRGLVLVKSWLLALPHLIVLGVLAGTWQFGDADVFQFAVGGQIGAGDRVRRPDDRHLPAVPAGPGPGGPRWRRVHAEHPRRAGHDRSRLAGRGASS